MTDDATTANDATTLGEGALGFVSELRVLAEILGRGRGG